jgi:sugar diacid utilization regulator
VRQPRAARERTISRVLEAGGPVREPGRVAVVAGPTDAVAGLLWMIDPDDTADEAAIVALEHGATIAAMELSRLRSLGETQLRLGRDLLDDLLAGVDPQLALDRARAIGCDLSQARRVAVVEVVDSTADEDRLIAAGRRAIRDDSAGSLLTTVGGALVVLADGDTDWQAFRATLVRSYDGPCRIGVGGLVTGPGDVPRSHREARLALKMGRESGDPAAPIAFDELGVFRLFAEVEEPASVERFVRTWLGPLLDYDARKPADLVPTLSRFLELGQAYDATSKALAIHRSTLKYRLQRIREISQRDLSDPDTRFNFQLATRAWQTLLALRATPRAEVDRQPRGVSQTR